MLELILPVVILALIMEFFDASVGVGYGTALAPLLLLFGFAPLEIIPAILLTNVIFGIVAGFFHHRFGNVDLSFKGKDFKITLILAGFGVIGILAAFFIAVRVPEIFLKGYLALLLLVMGITVLIKREVGFPFSWVKFIILGLVAAFNKGMTGGGYGPVLASGQILSGIKSKRAIAISLFAEGLVSIVGALAYLSSFSMNWSLFISLLIGGIFSVPLAAYVVKRFNPKKLRITIGVVNVLLAVTIAVKLLI